MRMSATFRECILTSPISRGRSLSALPIRDRILFHQYLRGAYPGGSAVLSFASVRYFFLTRRDARNYGDYVSRFMDLSPMLFL